MNWSRIRWLLMVCLLLTDCFLGILLYRQYRGEHLVSRVALEDAAQLLNQSGISLDMDIVPMEVIKDYVYGIPVAEESYKNAFAQMASSPVIGIYLLPTSTGMSLVFENGDRAEYYHNLYLTYTKSGSAEKDFSGTVDTFLQLEEDLNASGTAAASDYAAASGTAADAAKEVAKRFLAALTAGEGSGGVRLRPRTECVRKTPLDTVYLVEFTEELVRGSNAQNAAVINETRMYVLVEGETVWYLCGTWVPFLPNETYQTRKLDQVNILFSEMQRLKKAAGGTETDIDNAENSTERNTGSGDDRIMDTPAMAEADGNTLICTVLDMQRTYYILWDDAGSLYLRPAWQFSYCFSHAAEESLYQKIVCDAVTGSVVRQEVHVDASS